MGVNVTVPLITANMNRCGGTMPSAAQVRFGLVSDVTRPVSAVARVNSQQQDSGGGSTASVLRRLILRSRLGPHHLPTAAEKAVIAKLGHLNQALQGQQVDVREPGVMEVHSDGRRTSSGLRVAIDGIVYRIEAQYRHKRGFLTDSLEKGLTVRNDQGKLLIGSQTASWSNPLWATVQQRVQTNFPGGRLYLKEHHKAVHEALDQLFDTLKPLLKLTPG